MKTFNIESLPLEERIKLYDESIKMREERGWGSHKIGKQINVSQNTVESWIRGKNTPGRRFRVPDLSSSPELAYILGVFYGDGYKYRSRSHHIIIGLEAKDRDFVNEFGRCLSVICKRPNPFIGSKHNGCYIATISNTLLFEFLGEKGDFKKHQELIEKFPATFLRAIFDSDGCTGGALVLSNTDFQLLRFCQNLLHTRFHMSIRKIRLTRKKGTKAIIKGTETHATKNGYTLRFRAHSDLQKFQQFIGFTIKRKQDGLNKMLAKGVW